MNTKILVGSLRKDSRNLFLAKQAKQIFAALGEDDVEIIVPDLPLFSEDHEQEGKEPALPAARELREKLRSADRLLVCSPEYDRLPSAIILNACHWASRPPNRPLDGTPVMLAGVSSGKNATKNARPALQTAFRRLGCQILAEEIFVPEGDDLPEDDKRISALQEELTTKLQLLLENQK